MAELMTRNQVAKRLRVSPKTIARMVEDGRLPYAQKLPGIRGAFLFDTAAVEQAAAERAELLRARIPA